MQVSARAHQLKPMVFATMFSSLRRFPAHVSVHVTVTSSNSSTSWSMVKVAGRSTRPPTLRRCVFQASRGTGPWLRT